MVYVPGELRPLYGVREIEYGKTPPDALAYLAELESVTPNIDANQLVEQWSGDRSYAPASCVFERWDPALKIIALPRAPSAGYDWRDGLIEGALGSIGGTSPLDRLPSYSMLVEMSQGAANVGRYLYNGCKANTLALTVDKPGGRVVLEAELFASYITKVGASGAVTGLQELTLNVAEAAPSSSPPLQWKSPMTLEAGTTRTIYPQRIRLEVRNGMQRQGANVPGADGAGYALTAALHEGRREIAAEVELYLEDMITVDEMLANQSIGSLSTVIGGQEVTLRDGHYIVDADAWPALRHDVMTHTVRMRFSAVTIAGAT